MEIKKKINGSLSINHVPVDDDWSTVSKLPDDILHLNILLSQNQFSEGSTEVRQIADEISATYDRSIVAKVRAKFVMQLAESDSIRYISRYYPPQPTRSTYGDGVETLFSDVDEQYVSEGVNAIDATQLHERGITGQGVTVGVIDSEFYLGNPKYEENIIETIPDDEDNAEGFIEEGEYDWDEHGELHGTGSTEVLADVAPDVDLVLASTTDEPLEPILDSFETIGVDLVTHSQSYPSSGRRIDGEDEISDSIGEFTSDFLFFTSAGNHADGGHWSGKFQPNEDDLMIFDESLETPTRLPVYMGSDDPDDPSQVSIHWDADWDNGGDSYEVHLYDADDNLLVTQKTDTAHEVIELPDWDTVWPGTHYLEIELVDPGNVDGDEHFDLFGYEGAKFQEVWTPERSIRIPATSQYENTLAVAAVQADEIGTVNEGDLKPYSSQGPTQDGRDGIDIAAPSRVSGTEHKVYGGYGTIGDEDEGNGFGGTSAATPHAAGVAALLMSSNLDLTIDEVREYLFQSGRTIADEDVESPPNTKIGQGYVDARAAYHIPWDTLQATWKREDINPAQFATPAVDRENVYVGGLDEEVYAFSREDGSDEWHSVGFYGRDGALSDSSPVRTENHVFIGSGDGGLYRYSLSTGSSMTPVEENSALTSSPAAQDGVLYIGGNDGRVLAYNIEDDDVLWRNLSGVDSPVYSQPAVGEDHLFITGRDGEVAALDKDQGYATMWSEDMDTHLGTSSPTYDPENGQVIVAGDELIAFDAGDGSKEWSFGISGTVGSSPLVYNNVAYVGSESGLLYAIDAFWGLDPHWISLESPIASTPSMLPGGERLVVATVDGTFYLIDVDTFTDMKVMNSYRLPSETRSSPTVIDNEWYIGTERGDVYCLDCGGGFTTASYELDEGSGTTLTDSGEPGALNAKIIETDDYWSWGSDSDGDYVQFGDTSTSETTDNYVKTPVAASPPSVLTFIVIVKAFEHPSEYSQYRHGTVGVDENGTDGRFYIERFKTSAFIDEVKVGFGQDTWVDEGQNWDFGETVALTLTVNPEDEFTDGDDEYRVDFYHDTDWAIAGEVGTFSADIASRMWVGASNDTHVDPDRQANFYGHLYEAYFYSRPFDSNDVENFMSQQMGRDVTVELREDALLGPAYKEEEDG